MIAKRKKNSSEGPWMSISDMMSALMIIFLFISIAFMLKVQQQQRQMNKIVVEYAAVKDSLYNDLYKEFKNDLPKWDAELDKKTLSIRFQEPDILFDAGQSELNPEFKNILSNFFPRYIAILSQPKYKNVIEEIRIEGHTSSEWNGEKGTTDAYFNNMALSQARTRSVLEYVTMIPSLKDKRNWLFSRITANGLSYSHRIMEKGRENPIKSRRVEFRIRTNADEKMNMLEGSTK